MTERCRTSFIGCITSNICHSSSPLENQSYSNNPGTDQGRANPILPRPIQDRLEKVGLILSQDADPVKSSQSIDLKKQQVRNVVSFTLPSLGQPRKASLTGTPTWLQLWINKEKNMVSSSCRLHLFSVRGLQTQPSRQKKSRCQVSKLQIGCQPFSNQH